LGFSGPEDRHSTHPAGAARRRAILTEPRAERKGAPGFGAAQRTLAHEHGSVITQQVTGGAGGVS